MYVNGLTKKEKRCVVHNKNLVFTPRSALRGNRTPGGSSSSANGNDPGYHYPINARCQFAIARYSCRETEGTTLDRKWRHMVVILEVSPLACKLTRTRFQHDAQWRPEYKQRINKERFPLIHELKGVSEEAEVMDRMQRIWNAFSSPFYEWNRAKNLSLVERMRWGGDSKHK